MDLKDIVLGDGQLRFRVPASWNQTLEKDGSSAFYDEAIDHGTLRVKVMTFDTGEDLTGRTARQQLEDMEPEPAQTLEALSNGNALRVHRESADDGGQPTDFHVWLLAAVDPPHRVRLAVFTFTVLTSDGQAAAAAVSLLDAEIRTARFAHQVS